MRVGAFFFVSILAAGCCCSSGSKPAPATQKLAATEPATQPQMVEVTQYDSISSGALAFDPPVTRGEPPLNLARAGRDPSAFVGYDENVAEFFYRRVDDQQSYNNFNFGNGLGNTDNSTYDRRTVMTTVGVRYR